MSKNHERNMQPSFFKKIIQSISENKIIQVVLEFNIIKYFGKLALAIFISWLLAAFSEKNNLGLWLKEIFNLDVKSASWVTASILVLIVTDLLIYFLSKDKDKIIFWRTELNNLSEKHERLIKIHKELVNVIIHIPQYQQGDFLDKNEIVNNCKPFLNDDDIGIFKLNIKHSSVYAKQSINKIKTATSAQDVNRVTINNF
jgi:hypothetical protein